MTPEQEKVRAFYLKLYDQLYAIENECFDARGCLNLMLDGPDVPYVEWHNAAENLRGSIRRIEYRIKRMKELHKENR